MPFLGDPSMDFGGGDFMDYGYGPALDPSGSADTTDTGSGGDPYADLAAVNPDDYAVTPDVSETGAALSGGLMGTGDSMYPGLVRNAATTILGKPGGYALFQNQDGGGGSSLSAPLAGPGMRSQGATARAGQLIRFVRDSTGLRVSGRAIVALIVKYGFQAAATLTKLALPDLLFLFMRQKGVRHHRRGPGLYTVARKLRAAQSLQRTVARILGRGGHRGHRRHHAAPRRGGFRHMRRGRR